MLSQRCPVPADDFYERVPVPGSRQKQPWYVRRRDHAAVLFAGLWSRWQGSDGDTLIGFTVVTTTANALLAHIGHPRSPAVVPPALYGDWIDPDPADLDTLIAAIATPSPARQWEAWPVSHAINYRDRNGPELIAPVGDTVRRDDCARGALAASAPGRVPGRNHAADRDTAEHGLPGMFLEFALGSELFVRHRYPILASVGAAFVTGIALTLWAVRRILAIGRANSAGVLEQVDDATLRDALNAPVRTATIDLVLWLLTGTLLSAWLALQEPAQRLAVLTLCLSSGLYAGELTATFNFYAIETILSRRIWPALLHDGRTISSVRGVVGVPTWFRVGVLVLTCVVFPGIFLLLVERIGYLHRPMLIAIVATTVVSATWQLGFLLAGVSRPLGRLADLFDRSASGASLPRRTGIFRTDALGRFAEALDRLLTTVRERDAIRDTFGRYADERVVDRLLREGVSLSGERRPASVMFADIRGFTALSERLDPEAVVRFLNGWFERAVELITNEGRLPNKFIGDGILAVWGAPTAHDAHAAAAVRTALRLVDAARDVPLPDNGHTMRLAIGIHTGDVVAASIGATRKLEYGVISDTVNAASRIETLYRVYDTDLLISRDTLAQLPAELAVRFTPLEQVTLRGRRHAMMIYRLQEPQNEAQRS